MITWALLYAVTFIGCTLDSMFFDEYCDINSYHYDLNMSRKTMLRDIRSNYKY
jgi:hypothetical protein